jgi:hypothetical protein
MHRTVLSHPEEITANGTINVDQILQIKIGKILDWWHLGDCSLFNPAKPSNISNIKEPRRVRELPHSSQNRA